MMPLKNPKRVRRQAVDVEAFLAICGTLARREQNEIVIPLGNSREAKALRLKFYLWRREIQEVDPGMGFGVVARVTAAGDVIFAGEFVDSKLRDALAMAGITVGSKEPPLKEWWKDGIGEDLSEGMAEPPMPLPATNFSEALEEAGYSAVPPPRFPDTNKKETS